MCSIDGLSFWGKRYAGEGALWGHAPSETARELHKRMPTASRILEIGFGYGRDLTFLADKGHELTGVETPGTCTASVTQGAGISISYAGLAGFTTPEAQFDGLLAHRVWHLLGPEDRTRLVGLAASTVIPGGVLAISFRDARGFAPDQMRWIDDRRAEYRFRPGHIIEFWKAADVLSCFESAFDNFRFVETEEIESFSNRTLCPLTLMFARRKVQS
jgi:SAM-dependent methyltransferase